MRVPFLAFCAVLALSGAAPRALALGDAPRTEKRESLQQLLQRLRTQREAVVGELKSSVDSLVHALDEASVAHDVPKLEDQKRRLVQLGTEIGPLLIELVEPGANPTDGQKLRAQYVTEALVELKAASATARAMEIAQNGTPAGRHNAIRALGASPDGARAVPMLAGIYRAGGELRAPALAAIAKIGGPEATKVLSEAIADDHPETAKAALEALARAKNTSLAPKVLALLANTGNALQNVDGILTYYRALPDTVDKAALAGLLRLAEEFTATPEQRARVIDALPEFSERFDADARKTLRSIAESPTKELRESALIALFLVGDKRARREVLADYDAQIEQNQAWAGSYEARGNVLVRLREYSDAIADFTRSLQLARDDLRAKPEQSYVGLARCYVLTKKLDKAADTLRKSTLTPKQLRELAKDPAFAKMAEEARYRDVFQLK